VKPRVLIVDDEQGMCELIEADLRLREIGSSWYTSADEGLDALARDSFDVVLTDLKMPRIDGIEFCRRIVANRPDVPVVVMTAFGSMETAVAAIRAGAYDFITKPIEMDMLALTLQRAVRHRQLQEQVKVLSEAVERTERFDELLGASPAMQKLYDQLSRIADSETSVLLLGESGTGKELAARSLHKRSRRRDQPFVAVNCAALPDTLLESELFGHAKGAFTDARSDRKGLFAQAEGGTLFLDEITEMPLAMQPKLLRALEESAVRPVGGDQEVPFDARILAATNRDLESAVDEGRFRKDLYFRINVIQMQLPPLRSRGTDTLLLAQHFVEQFAARSGKQVEGISQAVGERLLAYTWPGNVRELRNAVEYAYVKCHTGALEPAHLPPEIREYREAPTSTPGPALKLTREQVVVALAQAGGNKKRAAELLGVGRATLYRYLSKFELS